MRDLLRLVGYVRPYARRVAAAVLSAFLISVCYLALLGLVQPIVDEVLPKMAAGPTATAGKLHLLDEARRLIDAGASLSPVLAEWSRRLQTDSRATAVLIAVLVVLLFVLKGLFTYLTAYLTRWTGLQVVRDLRADLYARIQRQ